MTMTGATRPTHGICAFGAYVPRLRLVRAAVREALGWTRAPMASRGSRAMASWDEDTVTMAVAAAGHCLADADRAAIDTLFLGSTTFPFADRSNAGIVAAALQLGPVIRTADFSGSQRAGTTALLEGLAGAAAGRRSLIVSAERRHARPLSNLELSAGDGAAALVVGQEDLVAEYIGGYSTATDFVDRFREAGAEFEQTWEERWVRDILYRDLVPDAIRAALAGSGIEGSDVDHFILPATDARNSAEVARSAGLSAAEIVDPANEWCGHIGTAHPLLMLSLTLDTAAPGKIILLAAPGQGVDVLLFRMLPSGARRGGLADRLKSGKDETSYTKYLAFNGLLDLDWGRRADRNTPLALSTVYRNREMLSALVGGECAKCGQRQFPANRVCVNADCRARDSQSPVSFANLRATVHSFSADYLTYSPSPPLIYGMIRFEGGGQMMAEFTDCDPADVNVGRTVAMAFRIREFDKRQAFRRYFWKAVPMADAEAIANG